jgi:hypothetical protein
MWNRFLIATILTFSILISNAQVDIDDIVFEETDYNFGVISAEGGVKTVAYKFKNNSQNTFVISGLEAACGCTNLSSDKEAYEAGEIGLITVDFSPEKIRGKTSKWVYIRGNYADGFQKELSFRAEVVSVADRQPNRYYKGEFGYLMMDRNQFGWGPRKKNEVIIDTLKLYNDGYDDIIIKKASSDLSFVSIENEFPLTLKVDSWTYLLVKADLQGVDLIGAQRGKVQLFTNDRFYANKELPIGIDISQDFSALSKRQLKKAGRLTLSSSQILMGEIKSGGIRTKSILLKNTGKSDLTIIEIITDCTCTAVTPSKMLLSPSEELNLMVTFDAINKSGPQGKVVTIITNDPINPRQTFVVKSVVK